MAASKKRKIVTVEVTRSFDNFRVGDSAMVELDPLVQGWVNAGVMRLREAVQGGEDTAGPGATGADDLRGSESGPAQESTAGAGAGEDPGSGGHGPSAQ